MTPDFNFTFLDLPKLNLDKELLKTYFRGNCSPVLTQKQINAGLPPSRALWHGITLVGGTKKPYKDNDLWNNQGDEFNKLFPQFFKLIELLPFKHIQRIQLWEQKKYITPHQDGIPAVLNDPRPYASRYQVRISVINENTEPTLCFFTHPLKIWSPKWELSDSDTFVYNNLSVYHMSYYRPKIKILSVIVGDIDEDKFEILLKRSLEKYKDLSF